MRRASGLIGLCLALAGGGCASSGRVERAAQAHEQKAAQLEARGDYVGAAMEREAADKQYNKAKRRAHYEASSSIYPPTIR
jgi:outer membrane murein-binding lipoprotein Lpp